MIVLDTGPIVALFDPKDPDHEKCVGTLADFDQVLVTTPAVLTEAFHILGPASRGSAQVRRFLNRGGAELFYGDDASTERAFVLMEKYQDQPMDFADASVIVASEVLETRQVFTLDYRDFGVYRIKRGHRNYSVEIV